MHRKRTALSQLSMIFLTHLICPWEKLAWPNRKMRFKEGACLKWSRRRGTRNSCHAGRLKLCRCPTCYHNHNSGLIATQRLTCIRDLTLRCQANSRSCAATKRTNWPLASTWRDLKRMATTKSIDWLALTPKQRRYSMWCAGSAISTFWGLVLYWSSRVSMYRHFLGSKLPAPCR